MKKSLKKSCFVSFMVLLSCLCFGTNEDIKKIVELKNKSYEAYYINKYEVYIDIISKCEDYLKKDSTNKYVKYYLAFNQMNLFGLRTSDSSKTELYKKTKADAIKNIFYLSNIKGFETDSYLLLEIMYSGLAYVFPNKSKEYLLEVYKYFFYAERFGENNPRFYLQRGIFFAYTPEEYGGGPNAAIKDYNKALELFKKYPNTDSLKLDWGYDETNTFIAYAYEQLNKYDEAMKIYKTILKDHPNYSLIKNVFMPQLEMKMNKKTSK